jgi:hypothetical protein
MMTSKQYEFCDDIWSEIKSYLIKPRARGNKCECCDKKWTKSLGFRETDIWWEGKQVRATGYNDWKNRDRDIPIPYGDYPVDIKVGTENNFDLKYYCDECWCIKLSAYCYFDYFSGKENFKHKFLTRAGDNKKNREIVDKIRNSHSKPDDNWLLTKHRLVASRQLQKIAIECLVEVIKDANRYEIQDFIHKKEDFEKRLESAKINACERFYTKLSIERFNRDLLKKFEKGEVKYLEFVRLFKK